VNARVTITSDRGDLVEAQAPVIVSASRSTDIPAFYASWLVNRIRRGHVVWYNPFNRQPIYISFRETRVIVFWTKNPGPLLPYLPELDARGIRYYFQYTLNDYEKEGFEPDVPPLDERVESFRQLSGLIGKERVIWRFDPLIVAPGVTPRDLLKKIWDLGNRLKGLTEKLVFSFVDVNAYRKVQNNLVKENVVNAEPGREQMEEIAEGLSKIRERWRSGGWEVALATCAEGIDLERYGIEHNRCVDSELIKRLFSQDGDLMYYLSRGRLPDSPTLFADEIAIPPRPVNLKDKGQRKACGCMISKDIGMYNTCRHHCVYCYANSSKAAVEKNRSLHREDGESLVDINS
jgi:DNA repair photolyase